MASEKVLQLDGTNFDLEVLQSEVPVLVDFWAAWCAPCRMVGPSIDELAAEYDGRAKVGKVNVDEAGDLAARFGITSIPALLYFKGGKVVDSMIGAQPKGVLSRGLDDLLA
jgi:thioredoxin 1